MTHPLPRTTVPDLVFAELSEAILGGRYAPGERLPTQRTLSRELEVNMASVRAALARLEQLRLVHTRHGDGTRVLDWRQSGGLETLAQLGAVDELVIADLFEARRLLLAECARLAAARRSDEQAGQIAELAGAIGGAADDRAALLLDWGFMSSIVQAAGNLVFQLIMNSVRELYLPRLGSFAPVVGDRGSLSPLYVRAARAIGERRADAAARALAKLAGAQEQRMLAAR